MPCTQPTTATYNLNPGRFYSACTNSPHLANTQSWNRFSFVGNNPINFDDPTGHMEDGACGLGNDSCGTSYDQSDYDDYMNESNGGSGTSGSNQNNGDGGGNKPLADDAGGKTSGGAAKNALLVYPGEGDSWACDGLVSSPGSGLLSPIATGLLKSDVSSWP